MNLRVRIVHDVLAISTRIRRGAERRIARRARPRRRGFTFSNTDLDPVKQRRTTRSRDEGDRGEAREGDERQTTTSDDDERR